MADKVATPAEFVPLTALSYGAEGEEAKPVTASNPLPTAMQYGASGVADVGHDFTTVNHTSPEFPAIAGRPAYFELTGPGSGVFQIEYKCADGSFAPRAVGTDGGSAILLGKVAYSAAALALSFETTIAGQTARARAIGAVTGAVRGTFRT